MRTKPELLQPKTSQPSFSRGFRRSTELGGAFTRLAVVFSAHVDLVVTNLRRASPPLISSEVQCRKQGSSSEADPVRESEERTKKELADTKQKLAEMEKKIDDLADMKNKIDELKTLLLQKM